MLVPLDHDRRRYTIMRRAATAGVVTSLLLPTAAHAKEASPPPHTVPVVERSKPDDQGKHRKNAPAATVPERPAKSEPELDRVKGKADLGRKGRSRTEEVVEPAVTVPAQDPGDGEDRTASTAAPRQAPAVAAPGAPPATAPTRTPAAAVADAPSATAPQRGPSTTGSDAAPAAVPAASVAVDSGPDAVKPAIEQHPAATGDRSSLGTVEANSAPGAPHAVPEPAPPPLAAAGAPVEQRPAPAPTAGAPVEQPPAPVPAASTPLEQAPAPVPAAAPPPAPRARPAQPAARTPRVRRPARRAQARHVHVHPRPVRTASTAAVVNGSYTVQPGDSLWRITAGLLVDRSSTAAVARAWPVLYAANRDRIGPDPDLIRPGTVLSVPDGL